MNRPHLHRRRKHTALLAAPIALAVLASGQLVGTAHSQASSVAARPTTTFDVMEATIGGLHKALENERTSCVDVVSAYIDRIEAFDEPATAGALSPNAIKIVNPTALDRAAELDARIDRSGVTRALDCVPVVVKDQVETKDMPTTYGSALFEGHVTGRDATVVKRLRDAGAIILAKTNLGEFASGFAGSGFGVCRNPYDLTRHPSSSSCGTGAAVAANFGMVGIAEDTGGSTVGPASVGNAVGLRPTTPLISRFGMLPSSPTQDTLGPLTRTIEDAAIVTSVIAGYDPNDPLTAQSARQLPDDGSYADDLSKGALRGKRIGVIRAVQSSGTDPSQPDYARVQAVATAAYRDMERLGARVIDLEIPGLRDLVGSALAPGETEAAIDAYLAELPDSPIATFAELANSDVVTPTRRAGLRSQLGRTTDDQVYLAAQQTRRELRQALLSAMAEHDLDAITYAVFDHEPYVIPADILTNPDAVSGIPTGSNRSLGPATGFPTLAVPAGFTAGTDLPVGINLMGRPYTEELLYQLGYAYEQGTRHRTAPDYAPSIHDVAPLPRATSTVKLTFAKKSQVKGKAAKRAKYTVKVASTRSVRAGVVELRVKKQVLRRVTVNAAGKATGVLPKTLKPGTYVIRAHFLGTEAVAPSRSRTTRITVTRPRG